MKSVLTSIQAGRNHLAAGNGFLERQLGIHQGFEATAAAPSSSISVAFRREGIAGALQAGMAGVQWRWEMAEVEGDDTGNHLSVRE